MVSCDFHVKVYDIRAVSELAVTLTFELLTLNFYNTSGVMPLNSVQNLSDIE